mmetsp:Transcript_42405/g.77484  ORF Transcript_42405/g.77484 Transcript_42405/m.77484 type:complete len:119 (-) Transcript_42405:499-855(-)
MWRPTTVFQITASMILTMIATRTESPIAASDQDYDVIRSVLAVISASLEPSSMLAEIARMELTLALVDILALMEYARGQPSVLVRFARITLTCASQTDTHVSMVDVLFLPFVPTEFAV